MLWFQSVSIFLKFFVVISLIAKKKCQNVGAERFALASLSVNNFCVCSDRLCSGWLVILLFVKDILKIYLYLYTYI